MSNKKGCPDNPSGLVPPAVLVASVLWLLLLIASFICFERVDAFADFAEFDLGPLPFEAIWFGAVGGWLISAQGIFDHNHSWKRSYDFWHYVRPVLGAVMGTIGCLMFIVLNEAATTEPVTANPIFYDVLALTLGYREASFRQLITKLLDTVIGPGDKSANAPPSQ